MTRLCDIAQQISGRPKAPAGFCIVCQAPVAGRRSDAAFCSSACRQKNYRRRRTIRNAPLNDAGVAVTLRTALAAAAITTQNDSSHAIRNDPLNHAEIAVTLAGKLQMADAGTGVLDGDYSHWGEMPDAVREAFEERAAIMEFDGLLPREEAERLAAMEVRRRLAPITAVEPSPGDESNTNGIEGTGYGAQK